MKTPEEMAKEYAKTEGQPWGCERHFLAGYKAAKDEYKVAIDTYNDVAKQMMEEAVRRISPEEQLTDTDKVTPLPAPPKEEK